MNKIGIAAIFIGITILSPVISMGIGQTREALLGLVPEESILLFADEIDKSRAENNLKIKELESTIDSQQTVLDEQKKIIDEQNNKLSSVTTQIVTATASLATTNSELSKQEACNKVRDAYINIPEKRKGNARPLGATNIVDLYKKEKHYLESSDEPNDDIKDDFNEDVKPAYQKFVDIKATCPTFLSE